MVLVTALPLHRRVRTSFARARLGEAAYEVAMDALHPALHEITTADERAWLEDALADALGAAAEAALDVLEVELGNVLEEAPASVRRKIEETPRWRVTGW
jgi:hypothetical protein